MDCIQERIECNMIQTVLLFNVPKQKATKIIRAALPLKLRVKTVPKSDFAKTLSELAGISEPTELLYDGEGISEEMMVLCGFSSSLIDKLFFAMKKTGAGLVKLTAILTETNKDWNVNILFDELKKEREQMSELKAKKEE